MISNKNQQDLWNENIPFQQVLVIQNNGENLGIMSKEEALAKSKELGYDLLCVLPDAKTPVCKMFNFDRYRFEQKQKEKINKKTQKASIVKEKEIRLTVNIGQNDLNVKAKKARDFLLKGDKVKVSLKYRGREMQHREIGFETIKSFYEKLSDIATSDKDIDKYKFEGNFYNIYLMPKNKKLKKKGEE